MRIQPCGQPVRPRRIRSRARSRRAHAPRTEKPTSSLPKTEPHTSEEEVIALANGTPYGLAAYVFTRDAARAGRCAERLQFGHVGINAGTGPTPEAPFGGMKQSGLGHEGGLEGMLEFCEPQTVATA